MTSFQALHCLLGAGFRMPTFQSLHCLLGSGFLVPPLLLSPHILHCHWPSPCPGTQLGRSASRHSLLSTTGEHRCTHSSPLPAPPATITPACLFPPLPPSPRVSSLSMISQKKGRLPTSPSGCATLRRCAWERVGGATVCSGVGRGSHSKALGSTCVLPSPSPFTLSHPHTLTECSGRCEAAAGGEQGRPGG